MSVRVPEDTLTLAELMFHAEQFCVKIEAAVADCAPAPEDDDELRLKIGQCRNILAHLQAVFDEDKLTINNASVRSDFRYLVMAVLWISFRARRVLDHRLFRRALLIEAGFSYLLTTRY